MTARALADSQRRILVALLDDGDMTPNELGWALGLGERSQRVEGSGVGVGRGGGHRVFGPAQRIIPALTGLRRRKLTQARTDWRRGDRLVESLTVGGREVAEQVKRGEL